MWQSKSKLRVGLSSLIESESNSSPFMLDKNKIVAIVSSSIGIGIFLFQHTQPASSIALLQAMAADSVKIDVIYNSC